MKQVLFIIIIFTVISQPGSGQTKLSLQQAIATGLANRYDVQANRYNITLAENTYSKSRKAWIPEINAEANIRYNMQLQATYIPPGFGGADKPVLVALGARNATILGITLQQPVIQPTLNTDIHQAQTQIELQKERNRADELLIKEQITTAYYNVLLKALQQEISLRNEQRFDRYYTLAAGKYKEGALVQRDYLRAQLDFENAKLVHTNAGQQYSLVLNALRYQLNLPDSVYLVLTDTLAVSKLLPAANEAAYLNRTEIRQLKIQQTSNQLQWRKAAQYAFPTVSVMVNYSRQYLYDDFKYTQGEWWSPFSYVGLRIAVPVSGNIRNYHEIRQYKLRSQQLQAELLQKTADVKFEVLQAGTELNNALRNVQTTRRNYEFSGSIYQQQEQEFALGSFSYDSLLETERSISNTEEQYINAVYAYLMAHIKYRKAIDAL